MNSAPAKLSTFSLFCNHFLRIFFAVLFVVIVAGTVDAIGQGHYQISLVFLAATIFVAYRIRQEHRKIKAHLLASKGEATIAPAANDDAVLKI